MNRILFVVACASFTSSLFIRMTDPLVPLIASEFAVDVRTAALVSTAFAVPWACMQPILGPLGDIVGKTRVIRVCLVMLTISTIVGAMATSFHMLLAARLLAGAAAGGVFPVSLALYGDMVPLAQRQVGMGRLLMASISGMMVGSAVAGVLADLMPWRTIFVIYGITAALTATGAIIALHGVGSVVARAVSIPAILENYRRVLSNPRSMICYTAVFIEGVALIGVFPFIAVLLVSIGETRASIAGLVLSALLFGGVLYSMLVGQLVPRFQTRRLMAWGGLIAAAGLAIEAFVPPWQAQFVLFLFVGFGFYLLHGCLLVQMTELAPESRGTAMAGHAFFYFSGQAVGPVAYGLGFATIGAAATIMIGAAVIALVGIISARLLHGRAS